MLIVYQLAGAKRRAGGGAGLGGNWLEAAALSHAVVPGGRAWKLRGGP